MHVKQLLARVSGKRIKATQADHVVRARQFLLPSRTQIKLHTATWSQLRVKLKDVVQKVSSEIQGNLTNIWVSNKFVAGSASATSGAPQTWQPLLAPQVRRSGVNRPSEELGHGTV